MNKVDELILDKEIDGISVSMTVKLILSLIIFIIQIISRVSVLKIFLVATLLFVILFSFLSLTKKNYNSGNASLIVDGFMFLILPIVFPLTQIALLSLYFTLLLIYTTTLNYKYPLGLTVIYIPYHIIFFCIHNKYLLLLGFFTSRSNFAVLPVISVITGILIYFIFIIRSLLYKASEYQIQERLSLSFSPQIAEKIVNDQSGIIPKPSIQTIAVLFSDITAFSIIRDKEKPEDIFDFMSDYRQLMLDTIQENFGFIDKFMGDGCMALFGTPIQSENPAYQAVKSALDLRQKMIEFNNKRREMGLFTAEHRIGIHYGESYAGNVIVGGSSEYTLVGNVVNIAIGLEKKCKELHTDILISGETARVIVDEINTVYTNDGILFENKKIDLYRVISADLV